MPRRNAAVSIAVSAAAALTLIAAAPTASAQWDPQNGEWGKSTETDLRVMTWNVEDMLRTENPQKFNSISNWNACARIVAGLRPDVLILQETGDNGCFQCVDSVSELTQVAELFMQGGPDPFVGGTVTSFVQAYAPGYDLPHIFVSVATDGFNRNVIMSRYPFADLDGDGVATNSDFFVLADAYTPAGIPIRGYQFAEIDLPDGVYEGDVVVGNGHLKSGGTSGDRAERIEAAQQIAYYIDYGFNGAGTGSTDPNNSILFPNPASILPDATPVIWGGDWNEDELTNGRKGPAEWMVNAQFTGGNDGTDRDRSDSAYDDARDAFTNARGTRAGNKLDYLAWQDSLVEAIVREVVFESSSVSSIGQLPEPVRTFPSIPELASAFAADHRPVFVDFQLALRAGGPCNPADLAEPFGVLDLSDVSAFTGAFVAQDPLADLAPPFGVLDLSDVSVFVGAFTDGCP